MVTFFREGGQPKGHLWKSLIISWIRSWKLEKEKNVGWFRISLLNGWFTIEPQKHNEYVDPCGRSEKVFFGACFFKLVLKELLYLETFGWGETGNSFDSQFDTLHQTSSILKKLHDFNFNYQPYSSYSLSKTPRLGGGFKYFYFHPYLGKRFPFGLIFFKWVGSTINQLFPVKNTKICGFFSSQHIFVCCLVTVVSFRNRTWLDRGGFLEAWESWNLQLPWNTIGDNPTQFPSFFLKYECSIARLIDL